MEERPLEGTADDLLKLHSWPNHNRAADLARGFYSKIQLGLSSLVFPGDFAFTLCHTIGYPANLWVHVFVDSGKSADEMQVFNALLLAASSPAR